MTMRKTIRESLLDHAASVIAAEVSVTYEISISDALTLFEFTTPHGTRAARFPVEPADRNDDPIYVQIELTDDTVVDLCQRAADMLAEIGSY